MKKEDEKRQRVRSGEEKKRKNENKINNLLCFLQIIRQNRDYDTLYATATFSTWGMHGYSVI